MLLFVSLTVKLPVLRNQVFALFAFEYIDQ